jgi:hypothetical protein
MVCWELRIEIGKFLNEHYSIDEIQRALAPPSRTRVETILELIENKRRIFSLARQWRSLFLQPPQIPLRWAKK